MKKILNIKKVTLITKKPKEVKIIKEVKEIIEVKETPIEHLSNNYPSRTIDEVYSDIRKKIMIVKKTVPAQQKEYFDLKKDIYFKIRTNKQYPNLWSPLNTDNVVNFLRFMKSVSGKNNLYFKISDEIIELLKIYTFISLEKENDYKLRKFIPTQLEFEYILCWQLWQDLTKLQMSITLDKRIFPTFKNFIFGRKVLEFIKNTDRNKELFNNYDIAYIDTKEDIKNKWISLNLDVTKQSIITRAIDFYINKMEKNNPSVKNMLAVIKHLIFTEFNFKTNLEWYLIPTRLAQIRNGLSRNSTAGFYKSVEESIKIVVNDLRENKTEEFIKFKNTPFGKELVDVINTQLFKVKAKK